MRPIAANPMRRGAFATAGYRRLFKDPLVLDCQTPEPTGLRYAPPFQMPDKVILHIKKLSKYLYYCPFFGFDDDRVVTVLFRKAEGKPTCKCTPGEGTTWSTRVN
jgi:hypothetical protein